MDTDFQLIKVEKKDKDVLVHLWNLYSYDFSIYDDEDVQSNGDYDFYYHDSYFDNDAKATYFIMTNGKLAGFVSISDTCYILNNTNDKCILDFFIMNKYRKGGLGKKAAYQLFEMYPCRWEVAQYSNNVGSKLFWERIIGEYSNNHYEVRTVYTKKQTIQAIILDTSDTSNMQMKKSFLITSEEMIHIHILSNVDDDTKNKLIAISEKIYPNLCDKYYEDLRKDLSYQHAVTIEGLDNILGFIMYTCMNGTIIINTIAIAPSSQRKEYGTALIRALKQHLNLSGLNKIIVRLTDHNGYTENIKKFFMKNGFLEAVDELQALLLVCHI